MIFFATSTSCGVAPTAVPTPPEAPTMNTFPISVIEQTSVPLTSEWRFSVDDEKIGEQQGWSDSNFEDSSWMTVNVPHTWNVIPEYSEYEG